MKLKDLMIQGSDVAEAIKWFNKRGRDRRKEQ